MSLSQSLWHVSQENVRCVMGYIVDLTVFLDDIFRIATGNVSASDVQSATDRHVRSGRRELIRDRIHWDINGFVTETFTIRSAVPQRDLVLEEIIDLIKQYCYGCMPRYHTPDLSDQVVVQPARMHSQRKANFCLSSM